MQAYRAQIVLTVMLVVTVATAEYFPLDELTEGQNGFGITEGVRGRLERFPIKILGIQEDPNLGFPLVLIRAEGDLIDRAGGISAGMSGSPIYLQKDGQQSESLLGAIAYVFPESDHHLALVTPISVMRDLFEEFETIPFGTWPSGGLSGAVPVATPLLLSGVSIRTIDDLGLLLSESPLELLPVQTGGTVKSDESTSLEAGSAMSVQLVRGDVTIAAIGTVTEIVDGKVLALGHPLLGFGDVSFPLSSADIIHIVPSDLVPFKLANSGTQILGSIIQDRFAGLAGNIDRKPDLLPINISLNNTRTTIIKKVEIVKEDLLYPKLLQVTVQQLLDEIRNKVGGGTSELAWEILFQTGDRLTVLQQTSNRDDLALATAQIAAEPLQTLSINPFQTPDLKQVNLNIRYENNLRTAKLVSVDTTTKNVAPGEMLVAYVRLQPFRDQALVEEFLIELPQDLEGETTLVFRSGQYKDLDQDKDNHEPWDEDILSFGDLLVALRDKQQASELVIEIIIDEKPRLLQRQTFPFLIQGQETIEIEIQELTQDETEEEE